MKNIYLLIFTLLLSLNSKGDQLVCLSKSTSEKASKIINQQELILLFCGCCDEEPQVVKVISTKIINDCNFEVVVTYQTLEGLTSSKSVDLAYVWMEDPNDSNKGVTIGQVLNLDHNPCISFDEVKNKLEENIEKSIIR